MTEDEARNVLKKKDTKRNYGKQYNEAAKTLNKSATKVSCIMCKQCRFFKEEDYYCSVLQVNWIPDNFGCVKGEKKNTKS